jgi:tRNA pseudouridine38-40 synthase
MTTFRITLAYDGTNYVGWQRQAAGTSIQGLIEDALCALDDRRVAVVGAGRTDAGVHALGQVASFSLARTIQPDELKRALNGHLPVDVRVIHVETAEPGFHARLNTRAKIYQYRFCDADVVSPFERHYLWHLPGGLDVDAMDRGARQLEGRHDFLSFQTVGGRVRSTDRTIMRSRVHRLHSVDARPERDTSAGVVVYEVAGDGFLRHMVRAIAGTLVEIGRGRWPVERMWDVLAARDRKQAGPTAPARGLFLIGVEYGDL